MKNMAWLLVFIVCLSTLQSYANVARTVISLYDGKQEQQPFNSPSHQMAEMPLNYLGVILEYHDIRMPLPDLSERADVIGVLHWLWPGTVLDNPVSFLSWAENVVQHGKKYVLIGSPGFYLYKNKKPVDIAKINNFFNLIGLNNEQYFVDITYDVDFIFKDPTIVEYESVIEASKPSYETFRATKSSTRKLLVARSHDDPSSDSILAAICANGGYIANNYAVGWDQVHTPVMRHWIINPWEFFRAAFQTDNIPKPDTSSIAGRRIFYSHVDGDGWNNYSEIEKYRKDRILSAEVIYQEVIKQYSDFPVTVTAIGADLDPRWAAEKDSQQVAKKLFALPHVEIGSHTYSHPFKWKFFEHYRASAEKKYVPYYLGKKWNTNILGKFAFLDWFNAKNPLKPNGQLDTDLELPREYGAETFDINKEIAGSVAFLQTLAPTGKEIPLITWSGDTSPFEQAIAQTRKAGLLNINGGDTRYDRQYPSYSWVSPIGLQVGKERQIYSSNNNENTYTDLWNDRFFGFQFLKRTINNTETPLRVKPFNVYYHMYSGEKLAALNALKQNLDYARLLKDEIAPIKTSHFAQIAEGFFSTEFEELGKDSWRVQNHGRLATIRFDHAFDKAVDFNRSSGVIGQIYYQGSLYVYIDESVSAPIISLQENAAFDELPASKTPYLIESRWPINQLKYDDSLTFVSQGYGDFSMRWHVPSNGTYELTMNYKGAEIFKKRFEAKNSVLFIDTAARFTEALSVTIKPVRE